MSRPDISAELYDLAAWIHQQLGSETTDRQWIAETAEDRVRDITLQLAGANELAHRTVTGPFETRREAAGLPAVQAIYDAMRATTRRGVMAERGHRLLCEACTAAGVDLGAYDHRVIKWLAGWEPEICAVVAGIISRAADGIGPSESTPAEIAALAAALLAEVPASCRAPGDNRDDGASAAAVALAAQGEMVARSVLGWLRALRLTPQQRDVLGQVFADAVARRAPSGFCLDCEAHPAGLCEDHAADFDKFAVYLQLAGQLGIEVDR